MRYNAHKKLEVGEEVLWASPDYPDRGLGTYYIMEIVDDDPEDIILVVRSEVGETAEVRVTELH